MPIEIKEIIIKATVNPSTYTVGKESGIPLGDLERIKKEITQEVIGAVLQKLQQNTER